MLQLVHILGDYLVMPVRTPVTLNNAGVSP